MRHLYLLKNLFMIMLLLFGTLTTSGQAAKQENDTTTIRIPRIPISSIPDEIVKFATRSQEIEKSIMPDHEIQEVDSVLTQSVEYLNNAIKYFDENPISDLKLRDAENKKREWEGYLQNLTSLRDEINTRNQHLQTIFEELNTDEIIWTKTRDHAIEKKVAGEIIASTEDVLNKIKVLKKKTKNRQDRVFIIYKNASNEITEIDQVITQLETQIKKLKTMIFVQDSPALWNAADSTSTFSFLKKEFIKSVSENKRIIMLYVNNNIQVMYYQIAFIILTIFLFLYLKRDNKVRALNEKDIDEVRKVVILHKPVASALVVSLLISYFFYPNRLLPVTELFIIIYMIPVAILLPYMFHHRLVKLLYILIGLFIIDILFSYIYIYSLIFRIILLLLSFLTLYLLSQSKKFKRKITSKPGKWLYKFAKFTISVYIIIISGSILSNIIGSVEFSLKLFSAVIRSLIFAVFSGVIVSILTSLLIFLTKENKSQPYQLIIKYQGFIMKRIKPFIEISGFLFWVFVTLRVFDIYEAIFVWIGSLMDVTWSLGKVDFSLGGLISFIIILTVSFALARMVKVILTDDYIKRSRIPRGIPEAISMTLRYIIIGFGVYLALSAAGVDLDKFGLIAGALGVGIGFGLQGIVYNFIAGLVLSYERPFHVGDTIEVNNLMGNVTEIGVRSSKILTFDGSEVIVPNGTLLSDQVINWTLSNQQRRLKIPVRTSLEANPRTIIDMLRQIAVSHPNTLPNPEPMVIFEGYGDSSLNFTLYLWVYFNVGMSTKSDVALQIYDALKEAGLDMPIPQQKVFYTTEKSNKSQKFPPVG